MRKTIIIWKLCLTTTIQGEGASFIEGATSWDGKGNHYDGYAILLTPWKRNKYREASPQLSFVIGWKRKEVKQQAESNKYHYIEHGRCNRKKQMHGVSQDNGVNHSNE